ncbi:efflux RND transporter periplasmic adaptor subunit, partial [Paenibacillus sepulcri]|nr:efflux RND transporter periplasmic adaptor subunit [Paenibacillus sepulcri]
MQLPETAGPLPASPGRSGKRYLRKVIFLFIVGIALLTLFSNTLLNYSVPQVTLQQAAPGALQYVISGSGAVEAAQTHDLYTSSVWPVSKVYVQTGDQVKNGQTLVTFDTKSAREALEDDRTRYEQRQIALEKLQEQYIEAQRSSDGQLIRTISLDIKSMQLDLEMMERQISRQEDSLQQSSVIKAPIDGIVIELNADRGAAVQAGMAAVRLADPAAGQRITLLLDSSQADRISVGDQAEAVFESLDNARIPAEVAIVRAPPVSGDGTAGSAAEPASGRKEVVLTLKDERLKGGETGEWTLVKKM